MNRTFYPKYSNYFGDGSGRDSYVVLNNGGLSNCDKKHMLWRPDKVPKVLDPKPYKKVASLAYKSDGSGRDSYVISNSGGLVGDFPTFGTRADVIFKAGLRQHHLSPLRNRNERWRGPDQTDYLNWMEPRHQVQIKKAAIAQRQLTERLSPPKMHHKYQNFAVTDGFTASGFQAPKVRNLSRFERQKIFNLDSDRRLSTKRRSEFSATGKQALQGITVARKPFDVSQKSYLIMLTGLFVPQIDADDAEVPISGQRGGQNIQASIDMNDPARQNFASQQVSPQQSPVRGSNSKAADTYRTNDNSIKKRRATTQLINSEAAKVDLASQEN